jgi:hypothetical protein
MRRLIITLSAVTVLAWAGVAQALDVPEGKAAVAEAVIGKASLTTDKGDRALKVGDVLSFGDRVSTGENGRIFLRLAGQAVTRLAANTELTLDPPGKRKGTFMILAKGFIRFLVSHRHEGEAFEVQANNAVAAVKGTDAGVENDGDTVQTSVYDSDHKDAMVVTDTANGQSHDLDPGQTGILGPDGFDIHDLTDQDRQHGDGSFQGLPPAGPDKGQGGDQGAGQGQGQGAGDATTGHADLDHYMQDALNDLGHDLKVDGNRESQDRNNDLAAGRMAVDRFGVQVQIANNLYRSAPDTVVLSTTSSRQSGPDKGISSAVLTTQWNQALPDDAWLTVVGRGLNDAGNFNPVPVLPSGVRAAFVPSINQTPLWYRLTSVLTVSNPFGDQLALNTYFSQPYYMNSQYNQDYLQDLWGHNATGGSQELYYNLHSGNAATGTLSTDLGLLASPTGTAPTDSATIQTYINRDGGGAAVEYGFYSSTAGWQYLYMDYYSLDAQGALAALPAAVANSVAGVYSGTIDASSFLGMDRNVNLEVDFNLPGFFSHPIDLMVMPALYDGLGGLLTILQAPSTTYIPCYGNCG